MADDDELDWPSSFLCPITLEVMKDPVMLRETGHTFEREDITQHLKRHKRCPLSNVPLVDDTLVPNHALRKAIEDHAELLARLKQRKPADQPASSSQASGYAGPPSRVPPPPPAQGSSLQTSAWSIDPSRVHLTSKLGRGNQGEVYAGELQNPNGSVRQVAIKVIDTQTAASAKGLIEEVTMMQRISVSCDNTCKLLGTCEFKDKIMIIMKLYSLNLQQLTEVHHGRLPIFKCCRYGLQVCKAMADLHVQNILALDIKPQNILWEEATDSVVIADFGISKQLGHLARSFNPQDLLGTPAYSSPEVWEGKEITVKADVWSFGCTLLEVASGRPPWEGLNLNDTRQRLCFTRDIPPTEGCKELEPIIKSCLKFRPEERPSFKELCTAFEALHKSLRDAGKGHEGSMIGTITGIAVKRIEKIVLGQDKDKDKDDATSIREVAERTTQSIHASVMSNKKVEKAASTVQTVYAQAGAAAAATAKAYQHAVDFERQHHLTEKAGKALMSAAAQLAGKAALQSVGRSSTNEQQAQQGGGAQARQASEASAPLDPRNEAMNHPSHAPTGHQYGQHQRQGGAGVLPHHVPAAQGYGARLGQGYGIPPAQGNGVPAGQGYGVPPGQGYGPPPGHAYGVPPGQGYGAPPGQGHGVPPGQRYGVPPGQGHGVPPGQGHGAPPDQIPVAHGYAVPPGQDRARVPQRNEAGVAHNVPPQDPADLIRDRVIAAAGDAATSILSRAVRSAFSQPSDGRRR